MGTEEKELILDVPALIKEPVITGRTGRPTKYTPELARSILVDIATSTKPISQIVETHGISWSLLGYWKALNSDFLASYTRAVKYRTKQYAEEMDLEAAKLAEECQDPTVDPRILNVKSNLFDRKWRHREWLMSRWNRAEFGDKIEVDQTITVNPAEERATAWQLVTPQAQDIEYQEIDPADDLLF